MSLHICNKSPNENCALQSCLKIASSDENNAVLLIENAVYAALPHLSQSLGLQTIATKIELYALKDDLAARGLAAAAVHYITAIDYAEFVQLCAVHNNSHSWY